MHFATQSREERQLMVLAPDDRIPKDPAARARVGLPPYDAAAEQASIKAVVDKYFADQRYARWSGLVEARKGSE